MCAIASECRSLSCCRARSLAAASSRSAQDYPSRPIKLLIHTPPGSLVDVLGRLVGQELGDRLGQSIIVDNRTGAATMIAVEQLDHVAAGRLHADDQHVRSDDAAVLKKSYRTDPIKDFTPVALVRDVVDGVRGQSEGAGEHAAGAGRLFQDAIRRRALRLAAAPAACCTSRSRCSSSRAAAISCTCRIAAARRPRPTRSPARSRWCRWGLPRRASPTTAS